MAMTVTAGQRGDSPQFIPMLAKIRVGRPGGGRPRTRPDLVLADKAYTPKRNRGHLRSARDQSLHPSKSDQDAHRKARGSRRGRPPGFAAKPASANSPRSNLRPSTGTQPRPEPLAPRVNQTRGSPNLVCSAYECSDTYVENRKRTSDA